MYKENWIQLKTDSTHARQLMPEEELRRKADGR
jgi:hypothetical protein